MRTISNNFQKHFKNFIYALFFVMLLLILATNVLRAQSTVFWTVPRENAIRSASTNSPGDTTTILDGTDGLNDPRMITLDAANQKIFWVNFNGNTIQSADLDGTNVTTILRLFQGVNFPYGIALDETNGQVYWSNWGDHSIHRASLSGGAPQTLFTRAAHDIFAVIGIGVDAANSKIYWLSRHNNRLRQADVGCGNLQDILTQADGLSLPNSLAMDVTNSRIFWTNEGGNAILSADLDGGNLTTLLDANDGLQQPLALSLDATATRIYWTNSSGDIKRAHVDGSNAETLLTFSGNKKALGIAVSGSDPVAIPPKENFPQGFALKANYPNPFNPSTTIDFKIGVRSTVSLKVYNAIGQEVKTLREGVLAPGEYSLRWDADNNFGEAAGSGVYVYRLIAGKFIASQKMLLLR